MIAASQKDIAVAPGTAETLATFPQEWLPVAASALCCLKFADRFLQASAASSVAAGEVGVVIRSALQLATKLADARDSHRNSTAECLTAAAFLAEGQHHFSSSGGIAVVGAAVFVQRDPQAEASEMLLLRQLHELKSEVLASSGGDRWCLLVEVGEEAVAVGAASPASAAGPSAAGGGSGASASCEFVVFDPRARAGCTGAHVVRFATIRGLQLHLLSVLRDTSKAAAVSLTVVMRQLPLDCPEKERSAREKLERRVLEVCEMEKRLLGISLASGASAGTAAAVRGTSPTPSQTAPAHSESAAATSQTAASGNATEYLGGADWSLDLDGAAAGGAGTPLPTTVDEEIAVALQLVRIPLHALPLTANAADTEAASKATAAGATAAEKATAGDVRAAVALGGGYEETKGAAPPLPAPPSPRNLLPPLPPSPLKAGKASATALPKELAGAVEGWISPGPASRSGGVVDGFDLAATFDAAAAFDAATAAAAAAAAAATVAATIATADSSSRDAGQARQPSTAGISEGGEAPAVAPSSAGDADVAFLAAVPTTKGQLQPPAGLVAYLTVAPGKIATSPTALPDVASAEAPAAAPPAPAGTADPLLRSLEGEDLIEYGKRAYDLLKRQLFSAEEEDAMFAASAELQGSLPRPLHPNSPPPPPPLRPATASTAMTARTAAATTDDWAAAAAVLAVGTREAPRPAAAAQGSPESAGAAAARGAGTTAPAMATIAITDSTPATEAALSPVLRNSEHGGSLDGFLDADEVEEAVSPAADGGEGYGSAHQSLDWDAAEDGDDVIDGWDLRHLMESPAGFGPALEGSGGSNIVVGSAADCSAERNRSVAENSGDVADDSGADRALRSLLAEFGPDRAKRLLPAVPREAGVEDAAGASSVACCSGSSGDAAGDSIGSNGRNAETRSAFAGDGAGNGVLDHMDSGRGSRPGGEVSAGSPCQRRRSGSDPLRGSCFHNGSTEEAPQPKLAEGQPCVGRMEDNCLKMPKSAVSGSGGAVVNGGNGHGEAPSPLEHLPTRRSPLGGAATISSIIVGGTSLRAAPVGDKRLATVGGAYDSARPVGATTAAAAVDVDAAAAAAAASLHAGVAATAASAEQAALQAEVRRRRLLIEEKQLRETEKRARRRHELCQTILGLLDGDPAPLGTKCSDSALAGPANRQPDNVFHGDVVEAGMTAVVPAVTLEKEAVGAASQRQEQLPASLPLWGHTLQAGKAAGTAKKALGASALVEVKAQYAQAVADPEGAVIHTTPTTQAATTPWRRADAAAAGEIDSEHADAAIIGSKRHTSDMAPAVSVAAAGSYLAVPNFLPQPMQQRQEHGAAWGIVVRDAEALAAAPHFGRREGASGPVPLPSASSPSTAAAVLQGKLATPPAQRPGSHHSEGIPAAVAFDVSFGAAPRSAVANSGDARSRKASGGGSGDIGGDSGGGTLSSSRAVMSEAVAAEENQEELEDRESPRRRRERLEALRARKLAGMEERRRGDDERRRRLREGRRRRATGEEEHAAYALGAASRAMLAALPPSPLGPSGGGGGGGSSGFDDANDPAAAAPAFWGQVDGLAQSTLHRTSNYGGYNGGHGGLGGGASNRKLVRNALAVVCLAGTHVEEQKLRALEALDAHQGGHFIILLSESKALPFKGLYACDADGLTHKIFGSGPPRLLSDNVAGFYKYNSAAREFRRVASRSFSAAVDAVGVDPASLRRRSLTSR